MDQMSFTHRESRMDFTMDSDLSSNSPSERSIFTAARLYPYSLSPNSTPFPPIVNLPNMPPMYPLVLYGGQVCNLVSESNMNLPALARPLSNNIHLPLVGFSLLPPEHMMHLAGWPFEQPKVDSPPDAVDHAAEALENLDEPHPSDVLSNSSPQGYPEVGGPYNAINQNEDSSVAAINSEPVFDKLALMADVASTEEPMPAYKENQVNSHLPVEQGAASSNTAFLALVEVCSLLAQAYEAGEEESSNKQRKSKAKSVKLSKFERTNEQRKLVAEFVESHPNPSNADYDLIMDYLSQHKAIFDSYQQLRRKVRDLRRKNRGNPTVN